MPVAEILRASRSTERAQRVSSSLTALSMRYATPSILNTENRLLITDYCYLRLQSSRSIRSGRRSGHSQMIIQTALDPAAVSKSHQKLTISPKKYKAAAAAMIVKIRKPQL
jgi:hypothetical protein